MSSTSDMGFICGELRELERVVEGKPSLWQLVEVCGWSLWGPASYPGGSRVRNPWHLATMFQAYNQHLSLKTIGLVHVCLKRFCVLLKFAEGWTFYLTSKRSLITKSKSGHVHLHNPSRKSNKTINQTLTMQSNGGSISSKIESKQQMT